jgi:hypothetical protein
LQLADAVSGNGSGARVYVNLRSDSITGTILATTASVFMPDGFGTGANRGYTNFFFSTSVSLTPGTTYYFQPVVQSGDVWSYPPDQLHQLKVAKHCFIDTERHRDVRRLTSYQPR